MSYAHARILERSVPESATIRNFSLKSTLPLQVCDTTDAHARILERSATESVMHSQIVIKIDVFARCFCASRALARDLEGSQPECVMHSFKKGGAVHASKGGRVWGYVGRRGGSPSKEN